MRDELTGMLNRAALAARVAELEHHSTAAGESVAVLVGDIDRFKAINDELGHAAGDHALAEAAAALRASLGPFEPIFRVGGDEFVALLPGSDPPAALAMAERLRAGLGDASVQGRGVTMSLGVAASRPGEPFDYEAVFAAADRALYEAKRAGGDRACAAEANVVALGAHRPTGRTRRRAAGSVAAAPAPGHGVAGTGVEPAGERSWFVADNIHRAHLLDVLGRIDRVGHAGNALLLVALIVAGPWYGWLPLAPAIAGGILLQLTEDHLPRARRPEYSLAAGWLAASVLNAVTVSLASHPPLPGLPVLTLMVVGFSAVFPARAVLIGGGIQAVLMIACGFVAAGTQLSHDPALLALPLALLAGFSLVGTVVGETAFEYRRAAAVDELTGLLSRAALSARVAEVEHQTAASRRPVALLIGDLDTFKAINDRHGHTAGDDVLREIGARLRSGLRAFESTYRFGGEEFLVLLPGVEAADAGRIAERLAASIRSAPVAGLPVTISFGVAATTPGEPLRFGEVFDRADRALYEAKCGGRDRVTLGPVAPSADDPAAVAA